MERCGASIRPGFVRMSGGVGGLDRDVELVARLNNNMLESECPPASASLRQRHEC